MVKPWSLGGYGMKQQLTAVFGERRKLPMEFKIDPSPGKLSSWIPHTLLTLLAKVRGKASPGGAFGFCFLPGGKRKDTNISQSGP